MGMSHLKTATTVTFLVVATILLIPQYAQDCLLYAIVLTPSNFFATVRSMLLKCSSCNIAKGNRKYSRGVWSRCIMYHEVPL